MRSALLAPMLTMASCLTASNYTDRSSAVFCAKAEECFKAEFDAAWDNVGECQDDVVFSSCTAQHCAFDAKAAKACLAGVRAQDCDAFGGDEAVDECLDVWVDCDVVELATCLAGEGFIFDTM